jgi:hypothetical protein
MTATISAWKDTPTHTLDVGGTSFAYRQLGPRGGTPLVFLHHFTAVLDDWDPRVIDPIAEQRHVITFDNRGVGASGGKVPHTIAAMAADAAAFMGRSATTTSTCSASPSVVVSRKRSPCRTRTWSGG